MIYKPKKHSITLIFIFFLVLIFVLLSSILITFGSNIYKETANSMDSNFNRRTCQAYLSSKIKQNDSEAMVNIEIINDKKMLLLNTIENGLSYTTYLYEYDGFLYEYFTRSDLEFDYKNGTKIIEMTDLSFFIENNLLTISFKDNANQQHTLCLDLHS